MKYLALIVTLSLPTVMAQGTFELADPAQEIFDDLQNGARQAPLQQVDANDSGGEWAIEGVSDIACSEFMAYRQERSSLYLSSLYWLQGFINGAVYQRFEAADDSRLDALNDPDLIVPWVENYCRENPVDILALAAIAFIEEY